MPDPNQNLVSNQGLAHLSQHHKNGCSAHSPSQSLNQLLYLQDKNHTSSLISAWYVAQLTCLSCNFITIMLCLKHTLHQLIRLADCCKTTSEYSPFDSSFGPKQSYISKSLLPVEYHTSRILFQSDYFLSFLNIPCTMWHTVISLAPRESPFLFTYTVPIAPAMQHYYFCGTPSLDFVLGNLNYTKIQLLIPHQPPVVCSKICFAFF